MSDKIEWHREGNLIYSLRQDGWKRGEPCMVNDVMIRVESTYSPIEPIIAALTAALAVEQKPVAWAIIGKDDWAGYVFFVSEHEQEVIDEHKEYGSCAEISPLYAAPVAAPVQVKALEWSEEQKGNLANQTVWPCHDWEYWIYRDDEGKPFILCMNITPDWLPASPVIGSFDTLEAAKAAAQADYETRIRSALISGDTSNG